MRSILLALFCFVFFTNAHAQTVNSNGLLKEILDLPAPPPVNAEKVPKKRERPSEFYAAESIPPDDAPLEDLLDYWRMQNEVYDEFRYNQTPSRESLKRILAAVEEDPPLLFGYLKLLPPEPDVAETVKRLYQAEIQKKTSGEGWTNLVRGWLRNNSDLFIGELTEAAKAIKVEGNNISGQEDLIALARVDWERARPIVEQFESNRTQSELYTLAKYVLYHQAVKEGNSGDIERYRDDLKKLVEDKKGSYKSRDLAMDALVLGGDFSDREDWYLSLLEDETLLELQENGFTGLTTLVRFEPNKREKWIPAMLRMLDGDNPTLRSVAVRNLQKVGGFGKKEILVKLLPWLTDASWVKESDDGERGDFITALGEIEIPESVPGLIAVVSNAKDENRTQAAKALVKYKSVEAIGVLRQLLLNEQDSELRGSLIAALVAAGGFSDDEMINALEKYAFLFIENQKKRAARTDDEENVYEEDEELPPVEISLGAYLTEYEKPTDGLVRRTIERIKVLQKSAPEVSAYLLAIFERWDNPLVDLEMLGWLNSSRANAETVLKLLTKRGEIRERVPNELALMRGKNAVMRGIGSVILDDKNDFAEILRVSDAETRTALLAFARLVRVKLPVNEVAPFLKSENKLLALAAERWLEAEDSVEARTILLDRFKAETRILGARQGFVRNEKDNFETLQPLINDMFQSVNETTFFNLNLDKLDKTENDLRKEMVDNPDLLAIYGFVNSKFPSNRILRYYKDKIVFTYNEDDARYWEKTVSPKEYEALMRFLIEKRIDNLASLGEGYGGENPSGEFLMFGRGGGRRVFYHGFAPPKELEDLSALFDEFNKGDRKLNYRLAGKINGLEVLLADEKFTVRAVWKDKNDFRVLVEDEALQKTIAEEIERQENVEQPNARPWDNPLEQKWRERRQAAAYKHFSWRNFTNGKLAADQTAEPSNFKYLAGNPQGTAYSSRFVLAVEPDSINRQTVDGEIQAVNGDLTKTDGAGAKTVIKQGSYENAVVSPDKKWIVAAKAEDNFYLPNGVVRVNLQTGKEFRVNLPTADNFYPVAVIPSQNKILLYRSKDERYSVRKNNPSPNAPEYYLLDAGSGATQIVKGEFRPLEGQTYRALQPTAAPNEFWAAIYNEKLKATEIGYYNALNFTFKSVQTLPEIELRSMDVWIDEPAAKIYFVYRGHLLAAPLLKR